MRIKIQTSAAISGAVGELVESSADLSFRTIKRETAIPPKKREQIHQPKNEALDQQAWPLLLISSRCDLKDNTFSVRSAAGCSAVKITGAVERDIPQRIRPVGTSGKVVEVGKCPGPV